MRRGSWLVLLLAIAGVAAVFVWWTVQAPPPAPARSAAPAAPRPADTQSSQADAVRAEPAVPEAAPAAPAPEPDAEGLGGTWAGVDLEEIRDAMPYNTYWRLAAPTQEPRVLQEREEERARWNVEYGKVLSGTATEEEIQAYYAHRQRLSADYVEFTSYVLDHHASQLSDQDVTLLELARRLHLARLEEYPRKLQEAYARKRQQDEARAAWLADEAALGAKEP